MASIVRGAQDYRRQGRGLATGAASNLDADFVRVDAREGTLPQQRTQEAAGRSAQANEARAEAGRVDGSLANTMERVLDRVLGAQRDAIHG